MGICKCGYILDNVVGGGYFCEATAYKFADGFNDGKFLSTLEVASGTNEDDTYNGQNNYVNHGYGYGIQKGVRNVFQVHVIYCDNILRSEGGGDTL